MQHDANGSLIHKRPKIELVDVVLDIHKKNIKRKIRSLIFDSDNINVHDRKIKFISKNGTEYKMLTTNHTPEETV